MSRMASSACSAVGPWRRPHQQSAFFRSGAGGDCQVGFCMRYCSRGRSTCRSAAGWSNAAAFCAWPLRETKVSHCYLGPRWTASGEGGKVVETRGQIRIHTAAFKPLRLPPGSVATYLTTTLGLHLGARRARNSFFYRLVGFFVGRASWW